MMGPAAIAPATATPLPHITTSLTQTTDNDAALQNFSACLGGGGQGDVLLLLDRSASLQTSDPTNSRVRAATYLVNHLSKTQQASEKPINLAIAGFDTTFDITSPWQKLTPDSAKKFTNDLTKYNSSNNGQDTDYWTALDAARSQLSQQKTAQQKHCSAIFWFTDGDFDIDPRAAGAAGVPFAPDAPLATEEDAQQAIAAGKTDLCRPGGVADQLRAQDVTLIGVGLAGSNKPDFGLLKGLTTNEGSACGSPTPQPPGAFFEASSIEDLYFAFQKARGGGATEKTGGVCTSDNVCPEGSHQVVLDNTVNGVHVLASADSSAQTEVSVTGPDGEKLDLTHGETEQSKQLGGHTVSWTWPEKSTVSLNINQGTSDNWAGPWTFTFFSSDSSVKTRSSVQVFGNVRPVWSDAPQKVNQGSTVEVPISLESLVDGTATPVDRASLSANTKVSAKLTSADNATVELLAPTAVANAPQTVQLPLESLPLGETTVQLTVQVVTADAQANGETISGTALQPAARDYVFQLAPPVNYPTITTKTVDFSSVETTGPHTATVTLDGAGCAWLAGEPEVSVSPQGVSASNVSSAANDAATCTAKSFDVALTLTGIENGLLAGQLPFNVRGENAGDPPLQVNVPFTVDVRRPVDKGVFSVVFVAVLLAGVLIPALFFFLVKWLVTGIPAQSLQAVKLSGSANNLSWLSDAALQDPSNVVARSTLQSSAREITLGALTCSAKTDLLPTQAGHVLVSGASSLAAGPAGATRHGKPKISLAVQGQWVIEINEHDPNQASVTVFSAGQAPDGDLCTRVRDDAQRVVPELMMRSASGTPTADAEWDDERPAASAAPKPVADDDDW